MGMNRSMMDLFDNMQIALSDAYIQSSTVFAVIVGILTAALIIATSFLVKKNKALGIVAGIAQIAGVFCTQKLAHIFMELELFRVITGSSQAEVEAEAAEYYLESMIAMIPYFLCSLVVLASWVISLIYIIKSMKLKPKVFPIFALILHIIRYVCISPIPMINALFGPVTEEVQKSTDLCNYVCGILPFVLLFIGALICFSKAKKASVTTAA